MFLVLSANLGPKFVEIIWSKLYNWMASASSDSLTQTLTLTLTCRRGSLGKWLISDEHWQMDWQMDSQMDSQKSRKMLFLVLAVLVMFAGTYRTPGIN